MAKRIKEKNRKEKKEHSLIKESQSIQKEEEISDKIKKIKIRVIGVGGGGGTIVSEIASRISSKVSFIAANTDIQALKTINKKVNCFQFGQGLTQGLGTGMNVDLGREAAQNEKDKIKKLCQGYDLCIIIACLGGGTGSGAAPVFAKISKSLGNLTYGIFTLPFKFEGEKKMEIAKESFNEVKSYLNAITLIPNEKVFQIIDKNTPLNQALSVINKSLAKSLEGLIKIIYEPALINIDFADFKTVLYGKGRLIYLNTVEVSRKQGSIKDLMTHLLNSPLYPYTIQGANRVLFNITGGKNLSLLEAHQISKGISELVSPEAKIIFGISSNKNSESLIKTTLLAVGCGGGRERVKQEEKPVKQKEIKPESAKDLKKEISVNRIRKNGLQIKKEAQKLEKEMEKEILDKEKFWERPAFLRRKKFSTQ